MSDEVKDDPTGSPGDRDASQDVLLRRCARCGLWKTTAEFHNSLTGQFSYCRECRREYDRRYYHERGKSARLARGQARTKEARAWMAALKEGAACADCGRVFPVWVMHWDHLPGHEKLGSISDMVRNRSRTITIAELKKCELVCANCHAIRTYARSRNVAGIGVWRSW